MLAKERIIVQKEWHALEWKRLAALDKVINIIFKKAKNNLGLEVPKDKISKIIIDKMSMNID